MNKIDRNKLRDNIIYFSKLKGLKIGDIERAIGRRLGIISRWKTKQINTIPLDDIYNISQLLDVTIEELINTDIKKLKREQEINELQKQVELINNQIKELKERDTE